MYFITQFKEAKKVPFKMCENVYTTSNYSGLLVPWSTQWPEHGP